MTDIREVLVDGIAQLNDWLDAAIRDLTVEQLNWLPEGKTVSCAFHTWHIVRTEDNIANFVMQRKPTVWIEKGYVERFGLPKVEQGTGMPLEDARAMRVEDLGLLREYLKDVDASVQSYVKDADLAVLEEVQMIRPLGEMTKWRVLRQVAMTHGFMHLGEINTNKGMMGIQFFL